MKTTTHEGTSGLPEAPSQRQIWTAKMREAAKALFLGAAVAAAYLGMVALLLWPVLDAGGRAFA